MDILDMTSSRIEEAVSTLGNALIKGQATDHSEYRYMCGQIRGLKVAQATINDLLRKQMENDDE
jgi:hypothetical protein